jgi:hypothetical protein
MVAFTLKAVLGPFGDGFRQHAFGWFLVLFWTPIFMVLFRSAIAPEIACFIGFFGNWPPFLRILENRPPNAV